MLRGAPTKRKEGFRCLFEEAVEYRRWDQARYKREVCATNKQLPHK